MRQTIIPPIVVSKIPMMMSAQGFILIFSPIVLLEQLLAMDFYFLKFLSTPPLHYFLISPNQMLYKLFLGELLYLDKKSNDPIQAIVF